MISLQQNQDLVVFSDHKILPHIDNNGQSIYSILYNNGTYPLWLINKIINDDSENKKYNFTISSFINNNKFMKQVIKTSSDLKVDFVDLTLSLQSTNLPTIIENKFKHITKKEGNVLVLEQPELLLSSMENLTTTNLFQQFINNLLLDKFQHLIIVSNIDFYSSYINSFHQYQYTSYYQSLQYKSDVLFNVKPLRTGFAKDISGTLTITKGGADSSHFAGKTKVVENEYFFFVNKDGSVKLFY
ncbi:hypothetical protein QEN19_002460 [Hanseniaspora menglaensis]